MSTRFEPASRPLRRPLLHMGQLAIVSVWLASISQPAQAQVVATGSASGRPGWVVEVNVSLDPQGGSVSGTQNDLLFDSVNTPIAKKSDGTPDCTKNSSLAKDATFAFHPSGCYGDECTRVRALIYKLEASPPIPVGSLYKCKVQIATSAPVGTYALMNATVVAADAIGTNLSATGTNGQVQVTGGGCQIQPSAGSSSFALIGLLAPLAVHGFVRRGRALRGWRRTRTARAATRFLILALALVMATAAAAAPLPLRSEGSWDNGNGSGQWQATLGLTGSGQLSGHLTLTGLPGLMEANLIGTLGASGLRLTLLAIGSGAVSGELQATLSGEELTGVLTTAEGATATLAGQWGEDSETAAGPSLSTLASGYPQDVMVKLKARPIHLQASTMRFQAGLSYNDPSILQYKANEFAAMETRVLSAMPSGQVTVLRSYTHLPVMLVRVQSAAALAALSAHPEVARVHENAQYQTQLTESLPLVRQPQASGAGFGGGGTTVAVLDTGADYVRPSFGDCSSGPGSVGCGVAYAQDFTEEDDGELDADGHGTNVSLIVLGMAPAARIAALDVFQGANAALDDIAAAIDWVIDNRAAFNIVGINLSLGTDTTSDTVCPNGLLAEEVAEVTDAGILAMIASGNSADTGGISEPACVPHAVRVGATYDADLGGVGFGVCNDPSTAADQVSCFSNSASFLTSLAPGCEICTEEICLCGTSQATPHVAGAAAVLRAANAFPTDPVDCTVARVVKQGIDVVDARTGLQFPRLDIFAGLSTRPNSVGDCNGNGAVTVDELIRGVAISLGTQPLSACPPFDATGNGLISIDELVTGVNIAVHGCAVGASGNP